MLLGGVSDFLYELCSLVEDGLERQRITETYTHKAFDKWSLVDHRTACCMACAKNWVFALPRQCPVHGTTPRETGQDTANTTSLLL